MENSEQEVPRHPVAQVVKHEDNPIALVDLGTDASEALRASWPAGRPLASATVIDSAWLLPMVSAGSLAASSLFAGNVFLATANPATLMTIGAGVGSAVMQGGTIVAQAPFVAASGALLPVVAPVLLFATVSSLIMGARLDRVQRSLGDLSEAVEAIRRHLEAKDYARIDTAASLLDDIRHEFRHSRRFASDVPGKLSRIEHDVNKLRSEHQRLTTDPIQSEAQAAAAVLALNRFYLATLLDLELNLLQLYLALQNDPDVVESREARLRQKIERYDRDFQRTLDSDPVGALHRKLKGDLAASRWRFLPRGWRRPFGGELAATVRSVRAIRRDSNAARARIDSWTETYAAATDTSREQCILFFREPEGERALRAYHTRDVRLQRPGHSS